jgi:hypothetical protein
MSPNNRLLADRPIVTLIKDRPTGKVIGEQWDIRQPDVNTAHRDYPELRYRVGDLLRVEAGGCVQTGGGGRTCKHYVYPKGPNSDRLYSGLIRLPGADPGSGAGTEVRIAGVIGKDISITIKPAGDDYSDYSLHLGYQDDDYTDNGYYSMDKGTDDHCNGVGWAWVRVTLLYNVGSITPSSPKAPLDLWWNEIDANSLPLNPKWGFQVTHGQIPDATSLCGHFDVINGQLVTGGCTTWSPTVDDAGTFNLICNVGGTIEGVKGVHGHINWGPVTYEGRIRFNEYSGAWPYDGDYNLELLRTDQAGVTTANQYRDEQRLVALDLEFDSAETIDFFDLKWWDDFHKTVDKSNSAADELIHDRDAIVIGLMGLDNQHGAAAELHPIYGLAIHTESTAGGDVWQIFARNSGNEGMCSQNQHYFPTNSLSFFFRGATAVLPTSEFHANVPMGTSWGARLIPGQAIVVTFNLPNPQDKAVIHGHLDLQRGRSLPRRTYPTLAAEQKNRHLLASLNKEPEEGTHAWGIILSKLADDKTRQDFLAACSADQRKHRRESKMMHWDVPGNAKVTAEGPKALQEKDSRTPTRLNSITRALEPRDNLLETRRLKFLQNLETAIGDRKAFETVLRQSLMPRKHE